jgi:hypothetical protein
VLEPGALSLLNELSGGHFGLLRELIGLIRRGERGRELLTQAVYDSPTIWAAVAPLREYEDASRFLADAVQREELGKAERFIRDSTLRRMYWLSLVARRKTGSGLALAWRSPAIREAARRIVDGA